MAKTKFITERPVIIVSTSSTSWTVRRDSTGLFHFTQKEKEIDENGRRHYVYKEVRPKPETLAESNFKCQVLNRYYMTDVDSKGNFVRYPDTVKLVPAEKALKALDKFDEVTLVKSLTSYYNTETGEKTRDRKVAESWFRGRNPIFISRSTSQQIGAWIKPGKDHVEIEFYVLDRCIPGEPIVWKRAEDTGFWLYPDGSISHFWKGRVGKKDRKFVEGRQIYHSLDPRSNLFQTSQWRSADLRHKEILLKEETSYLMSKETLKILEQRGFPKRFWVWGGDTSYKMKKTTDLVTYAKQDQLSSVSKSATRRGITEKNIKIDLDDLLSLVSADKDGLLIKVPAILLTYTAEDGSETPYPSTACVEGVARCVTPVRRLEVYCKYQLWIKNDASKIVYATAKQLGKAWKTGGFDNYRLLSTPVHDLYPLEKEALTREQQITHSTLRDKIEKAYKYILEQLATRIPILRYYQTFLYRNGALDDIYVLSFLDVLGRAPKTLEYIIKQYKSPQWLLTNGRDEYSLDHFLNIFGLSSGSFRERKTKNLYQNLSVTKEQFHFLIQKHQEEASLTEGFVKFLRNQEIPVPNRTGVPQFDKKKDERKEYKVGDVVAFKNTCYRLIQEEVDTKWVKVSYPRINGLTDISKIPFKYLQLAFEIAEKCNEGESYYFSSYKFVRLLEHYNFEDIATIMKRGLDIQEIYDYNNMIEKVKRWSPDFDDSVFTTIPKNSKHLEDLHREITDIYNLLYAERNGYMSEGDKNKKYVKKLKELKKYVMDFKDYVVLVPEALIEVVNEGAALSHCAATYVDRIVRGETYFFFLRKKETPEKPLVTFNISYNYARGINDDKWMVEQIHGKCDRSPTPEEESVVRKWAALHGIAMRSGY